MATTFALLPIIDISALRDHPPEQLPELSQRLYHIFTTTGFAYLINCPLSFTHDEVFSMARDFFSLPLEEKMNLAKKSFRPQNKNAYRGYFPTQPLHSTNNLKEGFEIGPPSTPTPTTTTTTNIPLSEPNIWPTHFPSRQPLETLYTELQTLSTNLLSLLALSLNHPADLFTPYLLNSLSTLRLLHYPPPPPPSIINPTSDNELCCTPHTDSGILTLLHQDPTGGLEVQNASGDWIPVPYIPGSLVVNIGDLMAKVSGGRFVATMHRVRIGGWASEGEGEGGGGSGKGLGLGRISVPFFFEPGEECVVRDLCGGGDEVVYGDHVRAKMRTWVEYQGVED
ncbi:putative iron/ascorbate oxidoreductase [Aspergillus sclerotioniger CBS 115572]|uniref:Putative iron/ascorbate oxidoreductase n=1 Tax=Aspergillus sclerotioniger CBS 115572 TaxID=1450535 RepID=A0A317XEN6_9EURO|nr:putative iron/ascorbate oxidoreductase [Aspergillus sclerotioniger CBS 115572]PWY96127.1 putative iron/ascorbate oxidoreductase [Aspergillus sclerotioniger CBS 115572]